MSRRYVFELVAVSFFGAWHQPIYQRDQLYKIPPNRVVEAARWRSCKESRGGGGKAEQENTHRGGPARASAKPNNNDGRTRGVG